MTTLGAGGATPARSGPGRSADHPSVRDLMLRLRDLAGRMVPFSETKLLLREAASMIERLDDARAQQSTALDRITAELVRERHVTPALREVHAGATPAA